jgi:hypothetical protein
MLETYVELYCEFLPYNNAEKKVVHSVEIHQSFYPNLQPTMAPTKKDKSKAKKTPVEKKSLDDATTKEVFQETKRSTRTPSSETNRSMRTPSSEKSAKEKRKRSSSSSARKKMRHSSERPIKVRLLDEEDDSSFLNKDTSEETEDEALESITKTPTKKRESALLTNQHGENETNSYSTPTNQEEAGPSPAELRVALADTAERLQRAEKQVRTISRTRIADSFQEGQVRSWTKENLWKQVKFITNDLTMNKIMTKAAKHFKVPDDEKTHWMSTYAHIVRDGLNQKRNACSQDLRKTLKSKY